MSDLVKMLSLGDQADNNFFKKNIGSIYEFYLTGTIKKPENYVDWFDIIRNAGANDVIKIVINSEGGDLFTAVQFTQVLAETEAYVIASVEGACMSAATMVLMMADESFINPYSMIMVHNYSGGAIGKGNEIHQQVTFEREWSIKFMSDIYYDFLSEKEIKNILNGQDLWLTGEETTQRLKIRTEKRKKEYEENQKQEKDDE